MRDLVQELVAPYADLRRQLTRDLRDPHYAADIAQTSFERVFAQATKSLSAGRTGSTSDAVSGEAKQNGGIESPRALLFRVARNLCIDEARHRKVAQEWVGTHATIGTALTAPSSEYILAQQRVLARVVETMEKLPPRRREVFLLPTATRARKSHSSWASPRWRWPNTCCAPPSIAQGCSPSCAQN
jgi:DNA-directed RNA polymerase specialized sigma24 family protein